MKIGIDARLYGTKHRGLGRYTQKLIQYLEDIDDTNEYFVFLQRDNFDQYTPKRANFKKVLADYRVYSLQEQLVFPLLLRKFKFDLVHFPHFNVPIFYFGRYVVTIHDLLISHYPSSRATTLPYWLYMIKVGVYRYVIRRAAHQAAHIITVSAYTKGDIIKRLGVSAEKISVTYEGVDTLASNTQTSKEFDQIKSPYLLYVGAAYPHKNLERLIQAFEIGAQENPEFKLVLVGKKDFFYERLAKTTNNPNIIFTGYVADTDLVHLYEGATAYIFPSLMEGFGLPALEAQAHNVSVISSTAGSLSEILGDSAYYFDPENLQAIAEAIKAVIHDLNLQQQLKDKGHANISRFSWQKMAETTHAIYTQLITK